MKNLKHIMCSALTILIGAYSLVACNNNPETTPPEPTEQVITLAEAKDLIVNQLESADTQEQTLNTSLAKSKPTGNRNIFVKFGTTEITFEQGRTGEEYDPQSGFSGIIERTGANWTKFDLSNHSSQAYFDGTTVYCKTNDTYEQLSFDSSIGMTLYALDCIYVDLLFIENAWVSIYENSATKTRKDYGYELTMNINMAKYVDFVMAESDARGLGSEGLFGDGDYRERNKNEGRVDLIVRFDSSLKIIGLTFLIKSLASSNNEQYFTDSKITITKASSHLSQPTWFNPADFAQSE